MSTILDALRRAEAERGNAGGSGLPPLGMAAAPPAPPTRRLPRWLSVTLLCLLSAGMAYWWSHRAPAPPAAPQTAADPAPRPAPPPPPLPAPAALLQSPGARALPAPEPPPVTQPATQPVAAAALRPPGSAASGSASSPVPRLADLPAALRQQLPPLRLGGSMHSPDPRLRSLILNGQLLREGDQIAPGLILEEIGQRGARLRWREQVFELPY
ncbi:MAG: general secretion pathway protein GspB [Inhella sp.]